MAGKSIFLYDAALLLCLTRNAGGCCSKTLRDESLWHWLMEGDDEPSQSGRDFSPSSPRD